MAYILYKVIEKSLESGHRQPSRSPPGSPTEFLIAMGIGISIIAFIAFIMHFFSCCMTEQERQYKRDEAAYNIRQAARDARDAKDAQYANRL